MDLEGAIEEFNERQRQVIELFASCPDKEAKYLKLIELGRQSGRLEMDEKIPENVVPGCQSVMYMHSWIEGGRVYFQAESEALISSGLAQVLIMVYSGLRPEAILKCPPKYLEELDISASLSPNRANGLYSIHLKMKQEALKFLLKS